MRSRVAAVVLVLAALALFANVANVRAGRAGWSFISKNLNAAEGINVLESNTIYAGAVYAAVDMSYLSENTLTIFISLFTQAGTSYPPTGAWMARWLFTVDITVVGSLCDFIASVDYYDGAGNYITTGIIAEHETIAAKYIIAGFYGGDVGTSVKATVFLMFFDERRELVKQYTYTLDNLYSNVDSYYTYTRNWFDQAWDTRIDSYGSADEQLYCEIYKFKDNPYEKIISFERYTPGAPQESLPPSTNQPVAWDVEWAYTSYSISDSTTETINIGSSNTMSVKLNDGTEIMNISVDAWSYNYTYISVVSITQYYKYKYVRGYQLGDWGAFNVLRDGVVVIINIFEFIYVVISYALTLIANEFWHMLLLIYAVLYNTVWYVITLALAYVAWGYTTCLRLYCTLFYRAWCCCLTTCCRCSTPCSML